MLNEMAIAWLLVFSAAPPPATAHEDAGRVRQDHQAKRTQVAPVSPQHGVPLTPPKTKLRTQKQAQHAPPGVTWYRLPKPTLHNQQPGPQPGNFGPEQPPDRDYGQDKVDDTFDYGGHDYNKAKLMSAGNRVRT